MELNRMASEEQRARRGERFLRLADVRSSGANASEAAKVLGDAAVTLLEGSPDGVAIIDGTGRIVYWNEAAEAQFGLERSRALAAECVARCRSTIDDAGLSDSWLWPIAEWMLGRKN
jgi:PAS domain-containing protein